MSQKQYRQHYDDLKNKWTERHRERERGIVEKHKDAFVWLKHHSKQMIVGSLGGLVMLAHSASPASGQVKLPTPIPVAAPQQNISSGNLIEDLSVVLPEKFGDISEDQEKVISQTLTRHFGFRVAPYLQGIRLNKTYGIIGAEQHLKRWEGDVVENMAPGRGAFGYFVQPDIPTEKAIEREKYYIAVQTFLYPGYAAHTREYYQFFKYRKMLVVNPENGKAMVVVIGDAGPSPWTGKHLVDHQK
jgi:hypothetical protein